MLKRGEIESRGKKSQLGPNGRWRSYSTYHVKYKARSAPKPEPEKVQVLFADWIEEQVVPPMEEPKVEVPKAAWNVAAIKPEPQGPVTPVAEREVLTLRHLSDIYKTLNLMADQQEALIEIFRITLTDLAETKEELEQERQRRNWWDKVKGLFA
jgi:C4-dicarboxylate-specific signal transduction histidine kinase